MVFDIITMVLAVAMGVLLAICITKQEKNNKHIIKLALKVAELEETVRRVDESTGIEINRLGKELRDFRESYGDAAVEELRQRAKKEKAFAEGLDNIMSYGAQYQVKE